MLKKIYYRIFQSVFNLGARLLPWRKAEIVKGSGSVNRIPELLKVESSVKPMIVSDEGLVKAGIVDKILAILNECNISYTLYTKVTPNPSVYTVNELYSLYIENSCDSFIAIGGGSVMDASKAAAARVVKPNKSVQKLGGLLKVRKKIPVIMLTSHSEKEKVFAAFSSGANGYCIKDIEMSELVGVINIILDGGAWFDKKIAGYIFEVLKNLELENAVAAVDEAQETRQKIKDLNITEREMEILKLISDGLTNAQIAEKLIISLSTVKNHVASIIHKLSVKDRTQVAIFALNNKLLD